MRKVYRTIPYNILGASPRPSCSTWQSTLCVRCRTGASLCVVVCLCGSVSCVHPCTVGPFDGRNDRHDRANAAARALGRGATVGLRPTAEQTDGMRSACRDAVWYEGFGGVPPTRELLKATTSGELDDETSATGHRGRHGLGFRNWGRLDSSALKPSPPWSVIYWLVGALRVM